MRHCQKWLGKGRSPHHNTELNEYIIYLYKQKLFFDTSMIPEMLKIQ